MKRYSSNQNLNDPINFRLSMRIFLILNAQQVCTDMWLLQTNLSLFKTISNVVVVTVNTLVVVKTINQWA